MFKGNLPLILASWVFIILILGVVRQRRHMAGAGLVLAFVLNLTLIHWVASFIYVLPWHLGGSPDLTTSGTEQSLYGLAAFAFGSLAIAPFIVGSGMLPSSAGPQVYDPRLPKAYFWVGALFYVLLSTPIGRLPSATAVISTGQSLAVVGISLCCLDAWKNGDYRRMSVWLFLAFMPPLLTVVTRGFIGYGAVATLSVLLFLSNFARSRIAVLVIAVVLGYVGLSVFVTYMRDRVDIRHSVWGNEDYSNRFDTLGQSVGGFEWFDLRNSQHLERLDDRLNQSGLVGAAVAHLEITKDYADGETLIDAVLAMVPRALWPDKRIAAGSGDVVARYTGYHYDNVSTSVGVGAVMELYINFGTTGVLVGFMVLGVIVTCLDIMATERLSKGDINGFVTYFLPGLSFLTVGGQFVEVTAGAVGAVVVVFLTNKYLAKMQRPAPAEVDELTVLPPAFHQA